MTKNIVVVGASRGIGKELVNLLAQDKNHQIVAFSRNLTLMNEHFSQYSNVHCFALDLDSSTLKKEILQAVEPVFQQIDLVIYNAGNMVNKPFLEITKEELQKCYQVNVLSAYETFQALIPSMLNKGGHIVSISSMGGFQGTVKFSGLSAYSTSKAALASLTELLAEEFKNTQLNFNCLALGAAQTDMLEEAFPGYQAPISAKEMATFIADFSLNAHQWFNGKILPVALSTP